jgi:KDO2-lipid IV(A) lauroyltransferase
MVESTVKGFYSHLAEIIAESMWMISASKKKLSKLVKIENSEVLRAFFSAKKSVIVVGGHIGNWELLTKMDKFDVGLPLGYNGDQLKFIYKKQHSKFADRFVRWIRESNSGIELIESNSAARYILKNRDKTACYFLFADQAPLPGSKFVTKIFNQQTLMINGPEVISKSAGLPVVFLNMERVKRGAYTVKLTLVTNDASKEDEGFVTERFASLLESSVNANPHNWLWSHKRWKRTAQENILKS